MASHAEASDTAEGVVYMEQPPCDGWQVLQQVVSHVEVFVVGGFVGIQVETSTIAFLPVVVG